MQTNQTGEGGGKPATVTPALFRQQLNQDRGNLTIPYQTLPTNIDGHTGSVHIKEYLAEMKLLSTRLHQPSPISVVEAYLGSFEKGGLQA